MPPMQQLPRDLWRFDVNVVRVADLSSPERLMSVRLPSPEPDRRQWPSFQTVGETLLAEGWAGLLYPAAARPNALALCLFRTADELSEYARSRLPRATRSRRYRRADCAREPSSRYGSSQGTLT
jgi:RES domain-containing protein